MTEYFRMKRMEIRLKKIMYESLVNLIESKKDMLTLIKNLYISLKDVPIEELRQEFIMKLAEIIHSENIDKNS